MDFIADGSVALFAVGYGNLIIGTQQSSSAAADRKIKKALGHG